jgi:hypothetical protein
LDYEPVLASAAGTVVHVGWYNNASSCHQSGSNANCGYGLHIIIDHGNGYRSLYAHLSSVAFRIGETSAAVRQGQIIGMGDHTGLSTGPHLHFEVRNPNVAVDPFNHNGGSLWLDGEQAVGNVFPTVRPIPMPRNGGEIIVDDNHNNNLGFSKGWGGPFNNPCTDCTGRWTWSSNGYAGTAYYAPADGGSTPDVWAKWQAQGTAADGGMYEVLVHVPGVPNKTWQAPYTIVDGQGATRRGVVDQLALPGAGYPYSAWATIGTYVMNPNSYVYVTDATGEPQNGHCAAFCNLGVDAIKFIRRGTTYLPDVRQARRWQSQLVIRNNGGGRAKVKVILYEDNGDVACSVLFEVNRNGQYILVPCSTATSAVVDADQDVAVVVTQQYSNPNAWRAYVGVEQPNSQINVPLLHKNNYGFFSHLFVQNAGKTVTNITIEFKASPGQPGNNCTTTYQNIPPNGRAVVVLSNVSCIGTWFVGSAFITNSANHALAVASTQHQGDSSITSISSYGGGTSNTIYAPLIQNNNYGWIAGIALQNASGGTNSLSATYYNQGGGSPCRTDTYASTGARIAHIIGAPGATCTTVASAIYSGSTLPVSAIINQALPGTPTGTDYEAITTPTTNVYVPLWKNQPGTWISGLVVQNATGQSASITIRYYDTSGNQFGSLVNQTLPARAIYVASTTGVSNGSLMITANQPIAVVVNHALSISGDGAMSHIGLGR